MQHPASSIQHPASSIQHPASSIQHPASSIQHPASLLSQEREILKLLYEFPQVVVQAGEDYSPATIANYVYDLSKEYNQFYQEIPVLKEEDKNAMLLRLKLSYFTGTVIKRAMWLLGIEVPERM
ncbi:MAG: DALR anticodon-binding domain-containing protein [Bacteroidales bacterium]